MKRLINKIKNAMNNHPRLFVLLLVLILIIVIFVLYRIADKYLNYSTVETQDVYTYVGEQKYEFEADITINRKGIISKVDPKININWSSSPIFSDDKIIFPKDMLVIFPEENYAEYRLIPFSYITNGQIITKDFDEIVEHYFLYDGVDTYVFSDKGTLIIGEVEISLSKYSYLICDSKRVTYYDYENKIINTVDLTGTATVDTGYYVVNVSEDTVGNVGNVLPSGVEYVDFISVYKKMQ